MKRTSDTIDDATMIGMRLPERALSSFDTISSLLPLPLLTGKKSEASLGLLEGRSVGIKEGIIVGAVEGISERVIVGVIDGKN